ncbi:pyridoxamine 5'-phosphate oxidase family protein [Pseudarthrobacter sp. J1763]|uniref:pyridoxamine 5'-phosphate oxidase family protein n=1 Tax=Pseudarthrobacter sp. J1763 TaxID=3420445 RepID=UPI003D2ABE81
MDQEIENIERLSPEECWDLLGSTTVGRLAVIVDNHPEIFPVNYVLDQNSIVFRTASGTKLWATLSDPCAFEIDGYDPHTEQAWSVVARGKSELMLDHGEKANADELHLEPWQPGRKNHYLRLNLEAISGRRFTTNHPDIWTTPDTDARTETFH